MKKGVKISLLLVLIVAVIAVVAVFSYNKLSGKPKPIFSENFKDYKDINELKNRTEYKNFKEKCNKQSGEVVIKTNRESNGRNSVTCDCFLPSENKGNSCTSDSECQSKNCDFSQAIGSGICALIKTDKDLAKNTYTYYYECSQQKPGLCSAVPRYEPEWKVEDNLLIETGFKEFPNEREEFGPI